MVFISTWISTKVIRPILIVTIKKHNKSYNSTAVIGTSKYNYELIPNKDGVEYFEVGPETITCEALDVEVTLDPELAKQIGNGE